MKAFLTKKENKYYDDLLDVIKAGGLEDLKKLSQDEIKDRLIGILFVVDVFKKYYPNMGLDGHLITPKGEAILHHLIQDIKCFYASHSQTFFGVPPACKNKNPKEDLGPKDDEPDNKWSFLC